MNAQEMFEKLGYKLKQNSHFQVEYAKENKARGEFITFSNYSGKYYVYTYGCDWEYDEDLSVNLDKPLLEAMLKQLEELENGKL